MLHICGNYLKNKAIFILLLSFKVASSWYYNPSKSSNFFSIIFNFHAERTGEGI